MGELYIRSQDKKRLFRFGISFNALEYVERQDYERKREKAVHHTICIHDGVLDEIAEYESGERCLEVLDEIEALCAADKTAVYRMPDEKLVQHVEDMAEEARNEGKPDFDPAEFIKGIGEIRGIGEKAMEKIREYAQEGGCYAADGLSKAGNDDA